jgi:hypothetical protein
MTNCDTKVYIMYFYYGDSKINVGEYMSPIMKMQLNLI